MSTEQQYVCIPVEQLTDSQKLEGVFRMVSNIQDTLNSFGANMTDLQSAVTDLQASVGRLEVRFSDVAAQVQPLKDSLLQANNALIDFQAADVTEDAAFQSAIDTLTSQLAEALGGVQAASDAIETTVAQVDAIGADPVSTDVPAEEVPVSVDAPVEEVPVSVDAPVEDPAPVSVDAPVDPEPVSVDAPAEEVPVSVDAPVEPTP